MRQSEELLVAASSSFPSTAPSHWHKIIMAERPYAKSDFVGLKQRKAYVAMIQRQPEKFPKGLNLSKINIADMQRLLLDSHIGFTTNLPGEQQSPTPVLLEPPNPKSAGEQQISPTLGLEDTTPDAQPDVRNVQLRIRDRRSGSSEFNVTQRVNINLVDNIDCRDNEWRASSRQIFEELQASIGQLDGSGRIGVPDSEEQEYTEYFVTFNAEDKTETFAHNLSNIIIPDGNKLELRVDPVHNKRPRTSSPIPASVFESSGPSSGALVAKPQATGDAEVAWLLERIQKRPGYIKFNSNRGKVLQNPDRVESWRFAAQVTSTFHKTSWPAELSSTTRISKAAIEKALGVSTTSLNEAINMTRIITIYGCDGPNRSAEVIAEVNKIQPAEALGASALKSFLQSWANDHPIVDS
ncbi:hypothetical protein B0H13DRAFT_1890644 [Mycena leptocephala]|nr:hypothetical protein B0H13DRAFT_1890644 [Mycena leptocephala]